MYSYFFIKKIDNAVSVKEKLTISVVLSIFLLFMNNKYYYLCISGIRYG